MSLVCLPANYFLALIWISNVFSAPLSFEPQSSLGLVSLYADDQLLSILNPHISLPRLLMFTLHDI